MQKTATPLLVFSPTAKVSPNLLLVGTPTMGRSILDFMCGTLKIDNYDIIDANGYKQHGYCFSKPFLKDLYPIVGTSNT